MYKRLINFNVIGVVRNENYNDDSDSGGRGNGWGIVMCKQIIWGGHV